MSTKKKFKIWTEDAKHDTTQEYCYVRLKQGETNAESFALLACDAKGEQIEGGVILVMDSKLGCIIFTDSMSDEIPLKTDITDTALHYTESEATKLLRPSFIMGVPEMLNKLVKHCEESSSIKPTIN